MNYITRAGLRERALGKTFGSKRETVTGGT